MEKNKLMSLTFLVFVLTLWVVGASEAQSTKPGKPLVLRVAELSPATGTRAVFLKKACSEVEKLTEGRIKTEIYWSESLVKVKEFPKAIQRGVCDVAWIAATYHPAEIPLWTHFLSVTYHPKGEDAGWITGKLGNSLITPNRSALILKS